MKEFLKTTLATIVGILIAGIVFTILGIITVSGMLMSSQPETVVKDNSIFVLELSGTVAERYQENPLDQLLGEQLTTTGLDDILASIHKAKENDKIKGIYLDAGLLTCGTASLQEIREALLDFKKSGKFIVAYSGNYTQGTYYLASVADKIALNPSGTISWHGLSAQSIFLKDLLDKIGVQMQIFRVGTYKSYTETFTGTEMSPANREQTQAYTQSIWQQLLTDVAASRNISATQLNTLADSCMDFRPAEDCLRSRLADTLVYKDQLLSYLKQRMNVADDEKLNTLTLEDMINVKRNVPKDKSGNIIAVYYAVGDIDATTDPDPTEGIDSERVIRDLQKLRNDESVKAVVLRVNSPGGSAYGAEQIWREVSLLKAEKPVIVSMGDYAASGGYYISCAADWIVAEPTTLTGSIGIFGMVPEASELINNKLGVHIDGVKTNRLADMGQIDRPMNEEEKALIQQSVNSGYELFTKRCADGRNMPIDRLKEIAEGRVWSGSMAKELKLVDELGGIQAALDQAVKRAQITEYTILSYPEKENLLSSLLNTRKENYIEGKLEATFGEYYHGFALLKNLKQADRIQARLPFDLRIQ
ncbi:signal peptide peptidase SppA [uncultured Phocaeicola sp.]|uniref:signal peptide peptidase SppA n=1 Tax=uncultured Phocaeicola sp. TaxID=990718 RepID=UPI0025DD4910|nr:signal peptide peptidase SppA [uncultured Phocaeicola sp.]